MQAEKEEEDEYRRQLMAKFAEDDRIEQMTAQKRRMKQLGKTYTYNKFVTGAIVNDSASFECILVCIIIKFYYSFPGLISILSLKLYVLPVNILG